MKKQTRPLRDFFDALRREPIGEAEVRAIVSGAASRTKGRAGRRTAVVSLVSICAVSFWWWAGGRAAHGPGLGAMNVQAALAAGAAAGRVQAHDGVAVASLDGARSLALANAAMGAMRGLAEEGEHLARRRIAVPAADTPAPPHRERARRTGPASRTFRSAPNERRNENTEDHMDTSIARPANAALTATATLMALSGSLVQAPDPARRVVKPNYEQDSVVRQIEGTLNAMLTSFWEERLAGYRGRADAALSARDLAVLNRLRVRFAVAADGLIGRAEGDAVRAVYDRELNAIYKGLLDLADSNRARLGPLAVAVNSDLVASVAVARQYAARLDSAEWSAAQRRNVQAYLAARGSFVDTLLLSFDSSEGRQVFDMLYPYFLEPLVLLYDGADMATFVRQIDEIWRVKAYGSVRRLLMFGHLPGSLNAAEMSVLRQNVPNPARERTMIPYTLGEESAGMTLCVFDARGEPVATVERGPEAAGDHAAEVDLTGVSAGMYYCRLTVLGASGSRVYSRTMQVVR